MRAALAYWLRMKRKGPHAVLKREKRKTASNQSFEARLPPEQLHCYYKSLFAHPTATRFWAIPLTLGSHLLTGPSGAGSLRKLSKIGGHFAKSLGSQCERAELISGGSKQPKM